MNPGPRGRPQGGRPAQGRPFLGIHFVNCGTYGRIYRNREGNTTKNVLK